jgi:O-antigen ligase
MSDRKIILHRSIMIGGLMIAAAALPFSVKICHGAIIVVLLSWLLEGEWKTKAAILQHSILLQLLLLLFMIQGVGLIFSDSLARGWFSLEKQIFFLLLPLALATTAIKLHRAQLKLVIASFVTACLTGTIVCILHAWHEANLVMAGSATVNPYLASSQYSELHGTESPAWLVFSYLSLSKGIGIHPTYFALFLAFSIIFLLIEFPSLSSLLAKAGVLILLLYFTMFIVFLSSRIVILCLAVIYISILVNCIVRRQGRSAFLGFAALFAFAIMVFLNPVTEYRSIEEINASTFTIEEGNKYTNAAQIRISLWWLALKSLKVANPLTGVGTGDVETAMAQSSEEFRVTNIISSFDPHNQYLYELIANGAPALLVLLAFLLLPLWWAWLHQDYLLLGFMFLIFMVCMTESVFELQKGIVFYSLMSGLLFYQANSFQNVSLNLRMLSRVGH